MDPKEVENGTFDFAAGAVWGSIGTAGMCQNTQNTSGSHHRGAADRFSKQGMARTAITNRTIRRTDQGAEIVLELWDGEEPDSVYPADASILQEARELFETYDAGNWNGFKGSNRAVLDGESFGFYVEFTDGSTISAYGTNSFPPHYQEVYSALWDLTAPAQEAYELEHPEESSTL